MREAAPMTAPRFLAAAVAILALSACAPPVLRGRADLLLRDRLAAGDATPEALAPLLAPGVEVHRATGTVRGPAEGAAALAQVKPDGATRLLRHHDVSLLLLGGGRTLLIQRDAQDRVTRAVELRPPGPGDGLPRRLFYYGAAWNTDLAPARLALCEASYARGARYVDPGHDVIGPEEVSQMIGNLRLVAPGSTIKYASGVADVGGGWMTEDWVMLSRLGGRVLFNGIDVLHLDADGKIDFLAGFIGRRNGE